MQRPVSVPFARSPLDRPGDRFVPTFEWIRSPIWPYLSRQDVDTSLSLEIRTEFFMHP